MLVLVLDILDVHKRELRLRPDLLQRPTGVYASQLLVLVSQLKYAGQSSMLRSASHGASPPTSQELVLQSEHSLRYHLQKVLLNRTTGL